MLTFDRVAGKALVTSEGQRASERQSGSVKLSSRGEETLERSSSDPTRRGKLSGVRKGKDLMREERETELEGIGSLS